MSLPDCAVFPGCELRARAQREGVAPTPDEIAVATLDAEIAKEHRDIRNADTLGDHRRRDLSAARYDGLTFARALLFGVTDECHHARHEPDHIDEQGRQRWRCANPSCARLAPL